MGVHLLAIFSNLFWPVLIVNETLGYGADTLILIFGYVLAKKWAWMDLFGKRLSRNHDSEIFRLQSPLTPLNILNQSNLLTPNRF